MSARPAWRLYEENVISSSHLAARLLLQVPSDRSFRLAILFIFFSPIFLNNTFQTRSVFFPPKLRKTAQTPQHGAARIPSETAKEPRTVFAL